MTLDRLKCFPLADWVYVALSSWKRNLSKDVAVTVWSWWARTKGYFYFLLLSSTHLQAVFVVDLWSGTQWYVFVFRSSSVWSECNAHFQDMETAVLCPCILGHKSLHPHSWGQNNWDKIKRNTSNSEWTNGWTFQQLKVISAMMQQSVTRQGHFKVIPRTEQWPGTSTNGVGQCVCVCVLSDRDQWLSGASVWLSGLRWWLRFFAHPESWVWAQPRRTSTGHTRCERHLWAWAATPSPAVSVPIQPTTWVAVVNQTSNCPAVAAAKVKRRRRGDKRYNHNTGLQNSGRRKNLPLPYDL